MVDFDKLEDELEGMAASAQPRFRPHLLNVELARLVRLGWPEAGIPLSDIVIDRPGTQELTLAAAAITDELGSARLTARFYAEPSGELGYQATLELQASGKLDTVRSAIADGLFVKALDIVKELPLEKLGWEALPGDAVRLSLSLGGEVELHVGQLDVRLAADQAEFEISLAGTMGVLRGDLAVGGQTLPVVLVLDEDPHVEADITSLDVGELLEAAGIHLPEIPAAIDLLHLGEGRLRLQLTPEPQLAYVGPAGNIGDASLILRDVDGSWAAVLGVFASRDFRLSTLHGALAPLSILDAVLDWDEPCLTLSNITTADLPFPSPAGGVKLIDVEDGIVLRGMLRMDSLGLELLDSLLGIDRLPLETSLEDAVANLRLTATTDRRLELLPGVVEVHGLEVQASAVTSSMAASARAKVVAFGGPLPGLSLGVAIAPGITSMFFETAEPWREPLGISGLVIEKVGLHISVPGPRYALHGDIEVAGRTVMMAAEFAGQAPTALVGAVGGDVSLVSLVQDLVGVSLVPDVLQMKVSDASVYIVAHPLGLTAGDRHYPPGLSVGGTLSFLGLSASAALSIDPGSGVRAQGALGERVRVGSVLRVSSADGSGPPSFVLDTTSDDLLALDGRVELLGLQQRVRARFADGALAFAVEQRTGPIRARINCTLAPHRLGVDASAEMRVRGRISNIRPVPGGPNLGTIDLDTGCTVALVVEATRGGGASAALSASLVVLGTGIEIPRTELSKVPARIEDLPDIVMDLVAKQSFELFADLFQDAVKYLERVAQALIKVTREEIGRVLREYFHKPAEQVADLAKSVLRLDAEGVAEVLRGAGTTGEEAAKYLLGLGFADDAVKAALQAVLGNQHVDYSFGHIDIDEKGHVDVSPEPHVNEGPHGHVDTGPKGHIDVGAKAHVDKGPKGHVDKGPKGHVNVRARVHVDKGPKGHVDKHWDAGFASTHTNTAAIPHVNVGGRPHVNTRAIPHVNARPIPHVNVKARPHVNALPIPHVDTPPIPHVDVRAKAHVDTPVVPHVDTSNHIDTTD